MCIPPKLRKDYFDQTSPRIVGLLIIYTLTHFICKCSLIIMNIIIVVAVVSNISFTMFSNRQHHRHHQRFSRRVPVKHLPLSSNKIGDFKRHAYFGGILIQRHLHYFSISGLREMIKLGWIQRGGRGSGPLKIKKIRVS